MIDQDADRRLEPRLAAVCQQSSIERRRDRCLQSGAQFRFIVNMSYYGDINTFETSGKVSSVSFNRSVLVVGGGVVGLSLAIMLANQGYVLHSQSDLRSELRSWSVNPATNIKPVLLLQCSSSPGLWRFIEVSAFQLKLNRSRPGICNSYHYV
jgi:hypothetical protein